MPFIYFISQRSSPNELAAGGHATLAPGIKFVSAFTPSAKVTSGAIEWPPNGTIKNLISNSGARWAQHVAVPSFVGLILRDKKRRQTRTLTTTSWLAGRLAGWKIQSNLLAEIRTLGSLVGAIWRQLRRVIPPKRVAKWKQHGAQSVCARPEE